jgi:lysyl-tRNA synthetase class 2
LDFDNAPKVSHNLAPVIKGSPAICFALQALTHTIAAALLTMADSNTPAQPAAAPAGESAANLHKDPVTGEMISKSELKKRMKKREAEQKKAEKAAAMPARPKAEKKEAEVELNPNVRSLSCSSGREQANVYTAIFRDPQSAHQCSAQVQGPKPVRRPHLLMHNNPELTSPRYPHKFNAHTRLPHFLEEHKNMKRGEEATDVEVRMGLRIMSIRVASAHLRFYVGFIDMSDAWMLLTSAAELQGRRTDLTNNVPV